MMFHAFGAAAPKWLVENLSPFKVATNCYVFDFLSLSYKLALIRQTLTNQSSL